MEEAVGRILKCVCVCCRLGPCSEEIYVFLDL